MSERIAGKALEAADENDVKVIEEVLSDVEEGRMRESDALVLDYISKWAQDEGYPGVSQRADDIAADNELKSLTFRLGKAGLVPIYYSVTVGLGETLQYFNTSEPLLSNVNWFTGVPVAAYGVYKAIELENERFKDAEDMFDSLNSDKDYFPGKESLAKMKDRLRMDYSRDI